MSQVRRHGVVPALELPHDNGLAAVPFLQRGRKTMTPAEARTRFPVVERCAYFNAGSVGPLSVATIQAMEAADALALERGRGAASYWEGAAAAEEQARERIAALLAVTADKVLLTTSTTEGCNIVITGLRLGVDDEVVTTDAEHPGLLLPLLASGARIKQARVLGRPAAEALHAVLEEVTPHTRLIAVSHVLWLNGHVIPLAEIKQATGLPLLVDGAQSVGAIPVDAGVADWYTMSGQKWVCGPETTGALYVADHERLRPQVQSFAASVSTDAARLRLVHLSPALVAGLSTAVEELPGWACERAAEMVAVCRRALVDTGLEVRTDAGQGTLISFRLPGGSADPADLADLVKRAEAAGVVIRHLPDGWLRASVGWWNDEADVARLAAFFEENRS